MELVFIAILGTCLLMAAELRDFLRETLRRRGGPAADAASARASGALERAANARPLQSGDDVYDEAA